MVLFRCIIVTGAFLCLFINILEFCKIICTPLVLLICLCTRNHAGLLGLSFTVLEYFLLYSGHIYVASFMGASLAKLLVVDQLPSSATLGGVKTSVISGVRSRYLRTKPARVSRCHYFPPFCVHFKIISKLKLFNY